MDNALDKLFEEIREAARAVEDAKANLTDLAAKHETARGEVAKACRRAELLDATLMKHIHEDLPVVQAKMVAHEEQDQGTQLSSQIAAEQTRRISKDSAISHRVSTIERSLRSWYKQGE